jgi:hypothetical protein
MKWRVDINKTPLQVYSICITHFAQPDLHLVQKQIHCYNLKTIHYSVRYHTFLLPFIVAKISMLQLSTWMSFLKIVVFGKIIKFIFNFIHVSFILN